MNFLNLKNFDNFKESKFLDYESAKIYINDNLKDKTQRGYK